MMQVLQVPGMLLSVSSVGIRSVRTASTRSAEILSICSVNLGVRSIVRPSVYRVDSSQAHCSARITHRFMVRRVGVGVNYFRWGQLEYLKRWQYLFREYVPRGVFTGNTLSISTFSLFFTVSTKKPLFFPGIYFVCCAGLYSAGHKVPCRNHDLAQHAVLTFQPQALN